MTKAARDCRDPLAKHRIEFPRRVAVVLSGFALCISACGSQDQDLSEVARGGHGGEVTGEQGPDAGSATTSGDGTADPATLDPGASPTVAAPASEPMPTAASGIAPSESAEPVATVAGTSEPTANPTSEVTPPRTLPPEMATSSDIPGAASLPGDTVFLPSGNGVDAVTPTASEDGIGEPVESAAGDTRFNLELVFENEDEIDPIVLEAFDAARQRWEQIVVGDVEDVEIQAGISCDGFEIPQHIDDLVIFVTTDPIDGPNGVLGSAGPCAVRGEGTPLPLVGRMIFDSADLLEFAELGRLEEIVLHEMGHVLGVGSLWRDFDLLLDPADDSSGRADTSFEGRHALAEFEALGGDGYDGQKVPVENTGGKGVANGHWRESVFGNELMTPFMSRLNGKLSTLTIASLEDIGYVVSYDEADEYEWPPPREVHLDFEAAALDEQEPNIDLSSDQLELPLQRVGRNGELLPSR